MSKPPELGRAAPEATVGVADDPVKIGLVELREDQGRQAMRPIANRPAVMPMATRAYLNTV